MAVRKDGKPPYAGMAGDVMRDWQNVGSRRLAGLNHSVDALIQEIKVDFTLF